MSSSYTIIFLHRTFSYASSQLANPRKLLQAKQLANKHLNRTTTLQPKLTSQSPNTSSLKINQTTSHKLITIVPRQIQGFQIFITYLPPNKLILLINNDLFLFYIIFHVQCGFPRERQTLYVKLHPHPKVHGGCKSRSSST